MRVSESCAACLYDKQRNLTGDPDYLSAVRKIIENRDEADTAPYLIYLFRLEYEKRFGKSEPYRDIKKKYNDLVLGMEERLREKIEDSDNPLKTALLYARAGNYIDFGAMNEVDEETFLSLLDSVPFRPEDEPVMESFFNDCEKAGRFLLVTDNCGEIVLDKLFLEQLIKHYPALRLQVLVRGQEVLNDATEEDAVYTGMDQLAEIIPNGLPMAGTVYERLPEKAREAMDRADVILAKGQGNYETLSHQGRHIFYSFLCKCDLFTERFRVLPLTGVFAEENREN